MSTDLHLVGYRYNVAAAVFFVRNTIFVGIDADIAPTDFVQLC